MSIQLYKFYTLTANNSTQHQKHSTEGYTFSTLAVPLEKAELSCYCYRPV